MLLFCLCLCVCVSVHVCPQISMSVQRAWLSATTTPAVSTCPAGTTVNAEVVSMTMAPTYSMGAPALVSIHWIANIPFTARNTSCSDSLCLSRPPPSPSFSFSVQLLRTSEHCHYLSVFLLKSLSSLASYMIAWLSYLSHLSYFEICDGCMSASSIMSPSRITRRLIRGLPTFTARHLSTHSDSHTQPIMRNSWGTHISPVLPLDVCAVCLLSHMLSRIDRQPESKIEKHQAYVFLVSGNSVDDIRRGEYSVRPDFKISYISIHIMDKYFVR